MAADGEAPGNPSTLDCIRWGKTDHPGAGYTKRQPTAAGRGQGEASGAGLKKQTPEQIGQESEP